MQIELKITATLTADGKLETHVAGPLDKPGLCLRLLAMAEATVKDTAIRRELTEGPGIVAAPAGALPPAPRFDKGGW